MTGSPKTLFQRFMVFTCVTSFIISLLLIFQTCIISEVENQTIFNWYIYTYTVFSGLVFIIVFRFFVNEKTKFSFHVRFIILYLIFTGIVSFFAGPGDVLYMLLPVTAVHYGLEDCVNDLFVYHDWLEETKENKTGKELIEHLFKNNLPALEFAAKMNSARNLMFTLGVIEFVFLLLPNLFKYKLPFCLYICSVILYFSIFIMCMMIGMFNKESFYSFLGFAKLTDNQKKLYKSVCLIFGASLLLALFFASNKALINIPKLAQKIPNAPSITYSENIVPPANTGGLDYFGALSQFSRKGNPGILAKILGVIFKICKYLLIAAAISGFILFLIRPLLSGNLNLFMKENPLAKFFNKLWAEIKDFFISLFAKEKEENYSTVGARKFNESVKDFLKISKKSKEKKLELDRLTKQFMTLINWGTKKEIKYTSNLAPAEYTEKLETYFGNLNEPEISALCHKTGLIFEAALYGKELISKDDEKCFNNAINTILAYGKTK